MWDAALSQGDSANGTFGSILILVPSLWAVWGEPWFLLWCSHLLHYSSWVSCCCCRMRCPAVVLVVASAALPCARGFLRPSVVARRRAAGADASGGSGYIMTCRRRSHTGGAAAAAVGRRGLFMMAEGRLTVRERARERKSAHAVTTSRSSVPVFLSCSQTREGQNQSVGSSCMHEVA